MQPTPGKLTDPVFEKPASYRLLDKFFLQLICDERDLPYIHFTIRMLLILIPYALLLFSHLPEGGYWLAAIMFHLVAHRILFKKRDADGSATMVSPS